MQQGYNIFRLPQRNCLHRTNNVTTHFLSGRLTPPSVGFQSSWCSCQFSQNTLFTFPIFTCFSLTIDSKYLSNFCSHHVMATIAKLVVPSHYFFAFHKTDQPVLWTNNCVIESVGCSTFTNSTLSEPLRICSIAQKDGLLSSLSIVALKPSFSLETTKSVCT